MLSIVCLVSLTLCAQTLQGTREAFLNAVTDSENSRAFHDYLKEAVDVEPTILAYKAVSEAMLAQVLWNPLAKFSQVLKYDKQMEELVAQNAENIEIRFLRLAIEFNLPSFLGMSEHLNEDISAIIAHKQTVSSMQIDPSYERYIFGFLETTGLCSKDQLMVLRTSINRQGLIGQYTE